MLQTRNLKGVNISKTKSCGFGSGKNGWRSDGHLILLHLMSEELCKQPCDSIVLDSSLIPPGQVHDGVDSNGVDKGAMGQRGEAIKSFMH